MIAFALLATLALDPPTVPAALPACFPTLRVPAPWPFTTVPLELRGSHLLVSRIFGGFGGFGDTTGVLDANTGAVVWLTAPTLGAQLATFLLDDIVVFAVQSGPGLYEMHAHAFGPDGQPGTADDGSWMFESGVGFTSLPDANDDEVAWLVQNQAAGTVELHRCDFRSGTTTPCVPGGPAVFALPFAVGFLMDAHPVGGSNVLLDRYNSNTLMWADPSGATSPWRMRRFSHSLGPFVAHWGLGPSTDIEPASQPPSSPWWTLPYRYVELSRAFGSNGGARAVAPPTVQPGRATVIDLGFGTYSTTTTSSPEARSVCVEGDQVAYLDSSVSGFYDVVIDTCVFL
jgi:hypothetical protein